MNTVKPFPGELSRIKLRGALQLLAWSCFALCLICIPAVAQSNFGSINGTVTDPSGAVLPGATVTVTDTERGIARTLTTDSAGQYVSPGLTPSNYSVSAEHMGFQKLQRTNINVGVGQAVRVDLALSPGTQTQTVTVSGGVPLINTSNEVLSSTVPSEQLANLPINGGLYTKVLDFQPGMHGNPGGNSPNYATNGAGTQGNYFLLDGVENTNMFVNSGPLVGAATSTDELTILPQDAVQEVNVMTNAPAEFGWFQGGVVNVGLKSGTNNLHGNVYWFLRNNNFDSYDPYLRGGAGIIPKQTDNFQQFGGSAGGPIKKDKLFYFAAYDGMRYTVGSGTFANVPTSAFISGNPGSVPYAIDNMIAQGVTPSPLSLALADCTVGAGGAACGNKGIFFNNTATVNNLPVSGLNTGHSNNVIGKVDYHPNDKNSFNGEYFFGQADTVTPTPGAAQFWTNTNVSRTQMMRAVWIRTPTSNLVNDVRFGYNRYNLADGNTECLTPSVSPNYAALGFISGATPPSPFCGFPTVNFNGAAGFASLGAGSGLANQGVFQYTATADDDVSWTHGKHQVKFGFEFHHTRFRGVGAPGNLTGTLNYSDGNCGAAGTCTDLQNFFAGNISNGNLLNNPQQEDSTVGFNRYALYIMDDFRASSRVTVNVGLRYELEPAIVVGNNNAGNFSPTSPTGMVQQAGNALYDSYYGAVAPRAGFAWDVKGDGTTVFRAGMGVSYDTPQIDDLVAAAFGAGLNSTPTGFALYNNTGLVHPAPPASQQAVRSAQLIVPGSSLNWASGTPVFPSNLSSDLACGTGNPAIVTPGGVTPSPCTLKARGTVIPGSNGAPFSMSTAQARSRMYTWTVGVEHAFGVHTSLIANYVGTHASNISSEINVNQPTPGASANPGVAGGYGPPGTATGSPQTRQPYFNQFPWFNGIFVYGPAGFSNYNSLQVSFVQRNYHGLTMNLAFTYARDLGTPPGGNNPYIYNSACVSCSYGLNTPTKDLGLTLVYDLPGRSSPLQMLKGWEISSTLNLQSGGPFYGTDSTNDFAGVGGGRSFFGGAAEPWSMYGAGTNFKGLGKFKPIPCYGFGGGFGCNPTLPAACLSAAANEPVNGGMNAESPGSSSGLASLNAQGCYMSANGKSVILPPAQGTFGNMRPGSLIGAPFYELDLSLRKNWNFHERYQLQASMAFFNAFNSTQYSPGFTGGIVNVPVLFGLSSQDPNNGNPVNGTGGPREGLLGLKFSF